MAPGVPTGLAAAVSRPSTYSVPVSAGGVAPRAESKPVFGRTSRPTSVSPAATPVIALVVAAAGAAGSKETRPAADNAKARSAGAAGAEVAKAAASTATAPPTRAAALICLMSDTTYGVLRRRPL